MAVTTRPIYSQIASATEGWDAELHDLMRGLWTNPYPVPMFTNFASLPTASNYYFCLAVAEDTGFLYLSNGSAWKQVTVAP